MLFSFSITLIMINILFFVGLFGLFFSFRSNFFLVVSIETMFLSTNLNFLFFSIYLDSIQGIVFIFFIIVISAVEIVIFLSFFVIYYKKIYLIDSFESFNLLKQ